MKYMGSKSRIAPQIVPIIQGLINSFKVDTYLELFVGGANVIDKIKCSHKIGVDINPYLIALLKRVQEGKPLLDEVSFEVYCEARTALNTCNTSKFSDWEIGNIGFLASYNGRFFDGGYAKSGFYKSKSPAGRVYRDYYREAKNNLLNQAPNLKDIHFYSGSYDSVRAKNCVVYLDPPYQGTKKYSYCPDFDYEKFWSYVRFLSQDNYVIISELEAPDDFNVVWQQEVNRSMRAGSKETAIEKLFMYKSKPII